MIKLYKFNSNILVWDADGEWKCCKSRFNLLTAIFYLVVPVLRKNYRIVGTFVGSLPNYTRQNTYLGLPLQLLPEQAKLLIDKKVAEFVILERQSTSEAKLKYDEVLQSIHQKYFESFKHKRTQEIMLLADKITREKMKKTRDSNVSFDEVKNMMIQKEVGKIELSRDQVPSHIHTCSLWENNIAKPTDFTFPETELESLRYEVFNYFWEKGFYLTSGAKFGCDFLVYEGDPLIFHSKFMVLCQEPNDLHQQLLGRLGHSVKKSVLIASKKKCEKVSTVSFKALHWENVNKI